MTKRPKRLPHLFVTSAFSPQVCFGSANSASTRSHGGAAFFFAPFYYPGYVFGADLDSKMRAKLASRLSEISRALERCPADPQYPNLHLIVARSLRNVDFVSAVRGLRVAVEDLLINDKRTPRDDAALAQHINWCHHSNQGENPYIFNAGTQTYAVDMFEGLLRHFFPSIKFQHAADFRELPHVDKGRRRIEDRPLPLTEKVGPTERSKKSLPPIRKELHQGQADTSKPLHFYFRSKPLHELQCLPDTCGSRTTRGTICKRKPV